MFIQSQYVPQQEARESCSWLKEFNELKDKILSLELNLKDSNNRLCILKQEIEQRDYSLVNAKKLENVLKSKLNEHLNQEKKYVQWLDKSRKDVMFSDDIAEKYAIEIMMLREKLDEANRVISKMSSSSNKVETLIKSGKHPCDKRDLGYINENDTPSSNKSTFIKASIESNVGTLSHGKAMKATEGASLSSRMFNGRTQQHKHQEATTSNARGGVSRVALQRGKIGASVQHLYSAPALFSRENRGALYVECPVQRLYSAHTATKLNGSGLYSTQRGLFVQRFWERPMQKCNPKSKHDKAIGYARCNQTNMQEEMLMNIKAHK
ncbi:hypothetical protein Q3G72_007663 [Acer saccharum]|nr:hypothetical protein Q3G72_007663 [Acer saccharum]